MIYCTLNLFPVLFENSGEAEISRPAYAAKIVAVVYFSLPYLLAFWPWV